MIIRKYCEPNNRKKMVDCLNQNADVLFVTKKAVLLRYAPENSLIYLLITETVENYLYSLATQFYFASPRKNCCQRHALEINWKTIK